MLPSSLSHNPALSLPSPSVQNQIHELAKTLPPPRKQNIACDACRYAIIIYLPLPCFITSCFRRPLDRQRKVKCHQLSGQPKVRLRLLFHSICSTNYFRPIPSAKYSTPLPCLTNSLTLSYPALYGQKLSMHVRSPRHFSPRRRIDLRLFRHHAQQATSEKKRISTVSRRPRAYTANTQQRSVFPLSLPHAAILFVFASK
jgi:hypothetical protein